MASAVMPTATSQGISLAIRALNSSVLIFGTAPPLRDADAPRGPRRAQNTSFRLR